MIFNCLRTRLYNNILGWFSFGRREDYGTLFLTRGTYVYNLRRYESRPWESRSRVLTKAAIILYSYQFIAHFSSTGNDDNNYNNIVIILLDTHLWSCAVCASSGCSSCRICVPPDCGPRSVCCTPKPRSRWDARRTGPCIGPPVWCCSATTGNTGRTSAAPSPPWTRWSLFGSGTLSMQTERKTAFEHFVTVDGNVVIKTIIG